MTPETALTADTSILDEAERIKHEILSLQEVATDATIGANDSVHRMVRPKLGYPKADEVYVGDLVDTNIGQPEPVITPNSLVTVLPISAESARTTRESRKAIESILRGEDDRMIAIVGPCSIHDPEEALEYAEQVKGWREQFSQALEIVMRVYVEKPRTTLGWKGLVYDPKLNDSGDINVGLIASRMLACQITSKGVPTAMERLNPLVPQYLNGLVAYDAIGARNATDQTAREYASGSSSPVGFKNTPEGNISVAVDGVAAANAPHVLPGVGMNGLPQAIPTKGNPLAHVVLRGSHQDGKNVPNYYPETIAKAKKMLQSRGLLQAVVVDASHGNSDKQASRQVDVVHGVSDQIAAGETIIKGVMIESNLVAGAQKLKQGRKNKLEYGKSITDECSGLEETKKMLGMLAATVEATRNPHA